MQWLMTEIDTCISNIDNVEKISIIVYNKF